MKRPFNVDVFKQISCYNDRMDYSVPPLGKKRKCCKYLTLAPEASLLQAGPDALDSPSMLRVAAVISTRALVLQHLGVVHQTYTHIALRFESVRMYNLGKSEGWFEETLYPW